MARRACSRRRSQQQLVVAPRAEQGVDVRLLDPPAADPPRTPQLFVKPDDRWEVNDLRQQNLEQADELERILRETVNAKLQAKETP